MGAAVLERLGVLPPRSAQTVATLLGGHQRFSGAEMLTVVAATLG